MIIRPLAVFARQVDWFFDFWQLIQGQGQDHRALICVKMANSRAIYSNNMHVIKH